jgi:hypothetical protein
MPDKKKENDTTRDLVKKWGRDWQLQATKAISAAKPNLRSGCVGVPEKFG